MDSSNNGGGGSTAVIIILILVIAVGVWYFTKGKSSGEENQPQDNSLNIDLSLGEENGETLPQ